MGSATLCDAVTSLNGRACHDPDMARPVCILLANACRTRDCGVEDLVAGLALGKASAGVDGLAVLCGRDLPDGTIKSIVAEDKGEGDDV